MSKRKFPQVKLKGKGGKYPEALRRLAELKSLLDNITITSDNHWLLTGLKPANEAGHRKLSWKGVTGQAHRKILEMLFPEIWLEKCPTPEDEVCHKVSCPYTYCVNPDCLYIGNAKTNAQDKVAKGTSKHSRKRLPKPLVEQILNDLGNSEKPSAIAKKYGLKRQTICSIRDRRAAVAKKGVA